MIYFDNSATSRYKPKKCSTNGERTFRQRERRQKRARRRAENRIENFFLPLGFMRLPERKRNNFYEKLHRGDKYRPVRDSETRRPRGNDRYGTQRRTSPPFRTGKAGVITLSVINPDRNLKINPCHVAKTIKENTALVALNAVSNVTGVINDFEKSDESPRKEKSRSFLTRRRLCRT